MKFFKVKEIAKIFKIPEDDIMQLIDRGLLRPVKYTKKINISKRELNRFLNACVHRYVKDKIYTQDIFYKI